MRTNDIIPVFKALADPVRLSILELLWAPVSDGFRTEEGICAGDIEDFLEVSQPTVSYHMKILAGAELVRAEKRGQRVYYECITEGMDGVMRYLERYREPKRRWGPSRETMRR